MNREISNYEENVAFKTSENKTKFALRTRNWISVLYLAHLTKVKSVLGRGGGRYGLITLFHFSKNMYKRMTSSVSSLFHIFKKTYKGMKISFSDAENTMTLADIRATDSSFKTVV